MKEFWSNAGVVLFVVAALFLGWGSIIRMLNGAAFSGYYQPQGYYMIMARM